MNENQKIYLNKQHNEGVLLDDKLLCILMEIERIYASLPKHLRVRVERWVEKISEKTTILQWKKNNNCYATLLLQMVRRKIFRTPFDKLPSTGPLCMLPRHYIGMIQNSNVLSRNGGNVWVNAYDRITGRTRQTVNTWLDSSLSNSNIQSGLKVDWRENASPTVEGSSKPRWRKRPYPISFVESLNEACHDMETALDSERKITASLSTEIEEAKRVIKGQTDLIHTLEVELSEFRQFHQREMKRVKEHHLFEISEIRKRHHNQLGLASVNNVKLLAEQKVLVHNHDLFKDSTASRKDAVKKFLSYIDKFQADTSTLTR